jgi:hypothetical protein
MGLMMVRRFSPLNSERRLEDHVKRVEIFSGSSRKKVKCCVTARLWRVGSDWWMGLMDGWI